MRTLNISLRILAVLLSLCTSVVAAVPPVISYQGRLTAADGTPFSGDKLVRFNIYSSTGTELWSSSYLTVSFEDGLFSVRLGESPQPVLPGDVFADTALTLGITVDVDPELSPRTAFTSQPYAFRAAEADLAAGVAAGSVGATEVVRSEVQLRISGFCPAGQFLRAIDEYGNVTCGTPPGVTYSAGSGIAIDGSVIAVESKGCSAGYVLKWNGAEWDCAPETGDISAVTAGSGLAGGGTSGNVTLWIPDEGISYTKIDTGGVRTAEILDYTIVNRDIADSAGIAALKIAGIAATLSASNAFTGTNSFSGTTSATNFRVGDSTFYANSTGVRIGDNGSPVSSYCLSIERNTDRSSTHYGAGISMTNEGSGFTGGLYVSGWGADGYGAGVVAQAAGDGDERYAVQGIADSRTNGLTTGASIGVRGISWDGNYSYGVRGAALGGTYRRGVYGEAATGYAGYFNGNAYVTGTLAKGGGSFKIDHPLDPENKFLQHSFVESPDMMNVYNGNIVTDSNGEAIVAMPDYFDALNRDFRYQLTVIGEFAQAIVAREIENNQFTIRTDKPNIKVSWQVTGIREDPFANANRIEVEVAKNADERGKYAHPEAWGQSETMGIDYVQSAASKANSLRVLEEGEMPGQGADNQQ